MNLQENFIICIPNLWESGFLKIHICLLIANQAFFTNIANYHSIIAKNILFDSIRSAFKTNELCKVQDCWLSCILFLQLYLTADTLSHKFIFFIPIITSPSHTEWKSWSSIIEFIHMMTRLTRGPGATSLRFAVWTHESMRAPPPSISLDGNGMHP